MRDVNVKSKWRQFLVLERTHLRNVADFHAAELGLPLVKRGIARFSGLPKPVRVDYCHGDTKCPAPLRDDENSALGRSGVVCTTLRHGRRDLRPPAKVSRWSPHAHVAAHSVVADHDLRAETRSLRLRRRFSSCAASPILRGDCAAVISRT